MVVDDIVQQGNVNASGGQISDNQNPGFFGGKFCCVDFSGSRIELRKDEGVADVGSVQQEVQVLDVVTSGSKNDSLKNQKKLSFVDDY
jgi:hypothetical protein